MKQHTAISLTAVVLAGGQGLRMNGQDKGLIQLHDKPLIAYSLEMIKLHTSNILISANRSLQQYQAFGYPVIEDNHGTFQGPLSGIQQALAHCDSDYLLVLACDIPALPEHALENMIERVQHSDCDICCLEDSQGLQPLVSILSRKLGDSLDTYIENGKRSVQEWVKQQQLCTITIENHSLMNINNPQELEQLTHK